MTDYDPQKRSEFEESASPLQFERGPDAVPENVFLVKMTYYFTR
jgi:hypothetical protein